MLRRSFLKFVCMLPFIRGKKKYRMPIDSSTTCDRDVKISHTTPSSPTIYQNQAFLLPDLNSIDKLFVEAFEYNFRHLASQYNVKRRVR